jgi:hypothetical protein
MLRVSPQTHSINKTNPLSRGLVLAHAFSEKGGTVAHDSLRRHDFTLNGAAFDIHGIRFDGSGYIQTPASENLNPGHLSIFTRCYIDADSNEVIFDKPYTSHNDPYYQYMLRTHAAVTRGFQLSLTLGGNWNYWVTGTAAYPTGERFSLAVTWNGVEPFIYVNGISLSLTKTGSDTGPISGYNTPLTLGRLTNVDTWNTTGNLDCFYLYNRALYHQEVLRFHADPYLIYRKPLKTLAVFAASSSTVQLDWTDNSGSESGFSIERSTTSATAGFAEIDTVGAGVETYNDTGLAADTYWYRVRAYDADGVYSDYSNVAEVTVT